MLDLALRRCEAAQPRPPALSRERGWSGWLRHLAVAPESRVDAAARAAWRDPVQFRRERLAPDSLMRTALDDAARRAGWGTGTATDVARGVALHSVRGGLCMAAVVELVGDGTQGGRIRRVVLSVDGGGEAIGDRSVPAWQAEARWSLARLCDHADVVTVDVQGRVGRIGTADGPVDLAPVLGPAVANARAALQAAQERQRALQAG